MRTYGRVHTAFWTDSRVRKYSDRARTMAQYLLTCPQSNMVGAFLLPDAYAADDLGWTLQEVKKSVSELFENGFCKRFADGRHIAICNFLKYNPVESSVVGKSIARQFLQLPKDSALAETIQYLIQQSVRLPESFANDLRTISYSTATASETAIATATAQEEGPTSPVAIPEEIAQDITDALRAYNSVAGRVGWAEAEKITKPRIRGIALRLRDCGGLEPWLALMSRAEASDFLTGRSPRSQEHAGWAPDLDWLIQPKNFTKLMEGSYDNRSSVSKRTAIDNIAEGLRRAAGVDRGPGEGMETASDQLLRLAASR